MKQGSSRAGLSMRRNWKTNTTHTLYKNTPPTMKERIAAGKYRQPAPLTSTVSRPISTASAAADAAVYVPSSEVRARNCNTQLCERAQRYSRSLRYCIGTPGGATSSGAACRSARVTMYLTSELAHTLRRVNSSGDASRVALGPHVMRSSAGKNADKA